MNVKYNQTLMFYSQHSPVSFITLTVTVLMTIDVSEKENPHISVVPLRAARLFSIGWMNFPVLDG